MKRLWVLLVMLLLGASFNLANAQEDSATKAKEESAQPVEVHNKTCPISHEEIGKDGMEPFKVTYKGKVYNLCCAMCEADFNKDPEKYIKIMEEEAAGS